MRSRLLVLLVVVLSACGGADSDAGSVPTTSTSAVPAESSPTTAASAETASTLASSDGASTTTRPAPNPDRPLAPDFSLTLSDGTNYQLSNETRPVYMVFWAEW